jgi:glycosyltransferase involved in cell wall biosynthesis
MDSTHSKDAAGIAQPTGRVLLVEEGGSGGIADYASELACALSRAGWDVHLATATDFARTLPDAVTVHSVFPYLRARGPIRRALRRLRLSRPLTGLAHLVVQVIVVRLARSSDVVHVQGEEWPPLGAVQALAIRLARRPLVYTPHNTFDRGRRSYRRSRSVIYECASRVIVHSRYDREVLPAALRSRVAVIRHGEYGQLARIGGTHDRAAERAALGIAEHESVTLLFGQLRPDKGVRDLLAAAREVEGLRVILAGEDVGGLDPAADLLADPTLRSRVILREGFLSLETAARLFAATDTVALPYGRASASGVLLLAYAFARPVVAYPVGGLVDYIVDGETGWLCSRPEPAALAQALREAGRAGHEECLSRGRAGHCFAAEHLAWDRIAVRTADVYGEALEASRPRRIRPRRGGAR